MLKKKKAQVWIETVIYTLIALAMIGAVLSFAKPKIEQMQDKSLIEDSIRVMEDMNSIMMEVRKVSGNQRTFDLGIKKGEVTFDAGNNKIFFYIDSKYVYSQIGEEIQSGSVLIKTEEISPKKEYRIHLTLDYSGSEFNLKLKDGSLTKKIVKASTLYKVYIVNQGKDAINPEGKTILELEIN